MTPQEIKAISDWNQKIAKPIRLTLKTSDSRPGKEMESFCDILSSKLSNLDVYKEQADKTDIPAIMIHNRIVYHAVPLGSELQPFLETLLQGNRLPVSITAKLNSISSPAAIRVFIAPGCPRCPAVVSKLIPLSEASSRIKLTVIDGVMFPELAEKEHVRSAPVVMVNHFRWTGEINLQELVNILSENGKSDLSMETIQGMIHDGEASRVAGMMIENQIIYPAFIHLLVHEKWPVRLGAMVVAEEIIDNDPKLASKLIEPVWERFHSLSDPVKGDMVYLFGESGTSETIEKIKTMLEDSLTDEVRKVALEAIESIKIKNRLS